MVREKAKDCIDAINADFENWFEENQDVLCCNILTFSCLKRRMSTYDVTQDKGFQRKFNSFFLLKRVPASRRKFLYERMQELKTQEKPISVEAKKIAEDLEAKEKMERNYFSFVTKMLCLVDDKSYPISDHYVNSAFRKYGSKGTPEEIYDDVINVYTSLQEYEIIKKIKEKVGCSNVGFMKILDAIFWIEGQKIKKEKNNKANE